MAIYVCVCDECVRGCDGACVCVCDGYVYMYVYVRMCVHVCDGYVCV